MRILSFLSLLFIGNLYAQQIPDFDWSNAGVIESYELDAATINFQEAKSSFSADVTDDVVMQQIIRENTGGAIIFLPAGEYFFTKQIRLSSGFVLKGEGSESRLIFNLEKEQDCILAQGKMIKQAIPLASSPIKYDRAIELLDASEIEAGEYLYLNDNDEELVSSSWAKGKTGQIVLTKKINGNQIELFDMCRRNFDHLSEDAVANVYKLDLVKWVGVEQLKIINLTKTEGQTSNIHFSFTENCWVGGVTSEKCNYSHVLFEYAVNCDVMGCHFSDAHDFGNGGKAYGVTLQFATGNCLILGNQFSYLRHAMLLQAGANGNVFYWNISKDPYWTDVRLPEDSAGDIVLHGNYTYANLIEGNQCQTIVVDNSHGKNGPDNLIFNNEMSGYGVFVHRKSPGQAIVNNRILKLPGDKKIKGRYRVKGKQYEIYNVIKQGDLIKVKPRKTEVFEGRESFWN